MGREVGTGGQRRSSAGRRTRGGGKGKEVVVRKRIMVCGARVHALVTASSLAGYTDALSAPHTYTREIPHERLSQLNHVITMALMTNVNRVKCG